MSRSYKKHKIYKDHFTGSKTLASKRVRRFKGEMSSGCSYKKYYPQYDVIEYIWYYPFAKMKYNRFKELHLIIFKQSLSEFTNKYTEDEAKELVDEYKDLLNDLKLFKK
jgi:hypothetical protein